MSSWADVKVGLGDIVHARDDERHLGQVTAIISNKVRVVWDDTGWITDHDIADIVIVSIDGTADNENGWRKRRSYP